MASQAVTFDVTHTLIHCPRLGEIYCRGPGPARDRASTPAEAARLVVDRLAGARLLAPIPGATASPPTPRGRAAGGCGSWNGSASTWGRRRRPASPPPSCSTASARAEAWEVYPEVPACSPSSARRGAQAGRGQQLGPRLPGLLGDLGLARFFDAVVYSSAVGVEKPDRADLPTRPSPRCGCRPGRRSTSATAGSRTSKGRWPPACAPSTSTAQRGRRRPARPRSSRSPASCRPAADAAGRAVARQSRRSGSVLGLTTFDMKISTKGEYGIRAMLYIAMHADRGPGHQPRDRQAPGHPRALPAPDPGAALQGPADPLEPRSAGRPRARPAGGRDLAARTSC